MKHGGDILSHRDRFKGRIIDFSSNINPLGYPEGLNSIISEGLNSVTAYPDIKYRNLKKEIAGYLGCMAEEVIVANGAVEIINNFSILFNRVIVAAPCFSEYIERPAVLGKQVMKLPLREDFTIGVEAFKESVKEGDLIILGNPNNPTGKRIDKDVLIELHNIISRRKAYLLLDEAFYEFCEEDYDSIELFKSKKDVCIIRAATKFFALPGIRLGYGFTSAKMVEKYQAMALPWCVNVFADLAGRVIFKDMEFIISSRKYIKKQRDFLLKELRKFENIIVYDTDCNFILIKLLQGTDEEVFDFLIKKGIMIRKASGFAGLDNSFIRIAVKSKEDNEYMVNCFKEYFFKR